VNGRPSNQLSRIDHIVILMMETRSFDSVAGWLYDPNNSPPFDKVPRDQPFEGVSGKDLSNPAPPNANGTVRHIPVGKGTDPTSPPVIPGESFAHVNTQLYGTVLPPSNAVPPFHPPYNLPDEPRQPSMSGFVRDYVNLLRHAKRPAEFDQYKVIMDCFTPETLPVLSTLAHNYAICDQWFCSVPSQTLSNRAFAFAASSSGLVDNKPYINWLSQRAPTIFNRIQEAKRPDLSWRIYYDRAMLFSLTSFLFAKLRRYLFSHFSFMERFYRDAKAGTLPSLSFIEPRFSVKGGNSQHPPASMIPGERLIYDVYQAVRQSPAWERTLLIITYDEHGGTYDHVPPPAALPPDPAAPPGQFGFRFDRLGPRICTVLVSPFIEPGTVFRAKDAAGNDVPLDHTAMIKTVTTRWGLKSLTARDASSPDLGAVLTRSEPRHDVPLLLFLGRRSSSVPSQNGKRKPPSCEGGFL
jgi:phospholipase C